MIDVLRHRVAELEDQLLEARAVALDLQHKLSAAEEHIGNLMSESGTPEAG